MFLGNLINNKKNLIFFLMFLFFLIAIWFINFSSFTLKMKMFNPGKNDSIDIFYNLETQRSFIEKPETVQYFSGEQEEVNDRGDF